MVDKIENDKPQDFTSAKLDESIINPLTKVCVLKIAFRKSLFDPPVKKSEGVNTHISQFNLANLKTN